MDAATLRALADRAAITELLHLYARAVDRLDVALGRSIFHPDATADYGAFYRGDGRGAIDAICESHRQALVHSHQITTTTIAIDGDRAGSETYHCATVRVAAADAVSQVTVWGRYLDRWSRRDGRWGIDHRRVVSDMDERRTVTPITPGDPPPRDRSCPSYAVLAQGG